MDWRHVGFDWNRVRAFLATAEAGSLSAAARALGTSQPTLSRQVAALEAELGLTLFERVGRRLVPTEAGLALAEHARAMGEAAAGLSLAAHGRAEDATGEVAVSATEMAAAHLLPPILARLRRDHPGIRVELIATDAASDLRRREADIAIRAFAPQEPDLIAARVGTLRAGFFASAAYVEAAGTPRTADDVAHLDFIGFGDAGFYRSYLLAQGYDVAPERFVLDAARYVLHPALARSGLGVALLPLEVGQEAGLERLLPDRPTLDSGLWLAAHRELRTSRLVRTVYDALKSGLSAALRR